MGNVYTVIAYRNTCRASCITTIDSTFEITELDSACYELANCIVKYKLQDRINQYYYGNDIYKTNIVVLVNGRKESDNKDIKAAYDLVPAIVEEKFQEFLVERDKLIEESRKRYNQEKESEEFKKYKELKAKFEGTDNGENNT